MSEYESDGSASSASSSSSSSSSSEILKPVFIKKRSADTKTDTKIGTKTSGAKEQVGVTKAMVAKIEARVGQDDATDDYDGADDTDDVDPQRELELWLQREHARMQRDRTVLAEREQARQDQVRGTQGKV